MKPLFNIVFLFACNSIQISLGKDDQIEVPFNRNEELLEEGRRQLVRLKSQMPRYGECWKNALYDLEHGCKDMNEQSQGQMALAFANCFLEAMGQKGYKCSKNEELKICLKNIDQKAFIVYTEFFTHTQNICFFLQNQIWHEETQDTITRLTLSSGKVMRQLDNAAGKQEEILSAQNVVISNQKDMLDSGSQLNDYLENSRKIAHSMYNEFQMTTTEQKMLITDVFDRISKLQNFMLGEFAGLYTLAFYLIALLVSYLMTSSNRTGDARIWLYLILSLNFIAEKYITSSFVVLENFERKLLENDGPTYTYIWMCRKLCCTLCGLTLVFHAFTYKNLNSINNCLLLDIKKQMEQITQLKEGLIEDKVNSNSVHTIDEQVAIENQYSSDSDSNSDESFVTTFVNFNTVNDIKLEPVSNSHFYKEQLTNYTKPSIVYNLRRRSVMSPKFFKVRDEIMDKIKEEDHSHKEN